MSAKEKPEFKINTSIEPSTEMLARIHSVIEEYCDKELEKVVRKLLPEVVQKCLKEKAVKKETVELRSIPKKKAKALIKAYIDEHQGCRTGDIIYDLRLDPDLVLKILKGLEKEKVIRGE